MASTRFSRCSPRSCCGSARAAWPSAPCTSAWTRICRGFQLALLVQLGLGVVNLLLLVPLWTQLFHLLAADAVMITFALLAAQVLTPESLAVSE